MRQLDGVMGDRARAGDAESMKMEMEMEMCIKADYDGVVRSLSVQAWEMV